MKRTSGGSARAVALLVACFLICAAAAVCAADPIAPAARPGERGGGLLDGNVGGDWLGFGRTYGEQHFSPLRQIDRQTVGQLHLAWSLDLPPGLSSTAPVVHDGILYFTRGYSVVSAVDAKVGKLLWTFDPKVTAVAGDKLRGTWGSRGIAWWNGKIYVGTADGRLIAINASTGRQVWAAMTVQKDDQRYITGAPRVFAGRVVIGHGGADWGAVRGYVTAYDAENGKQLWRFYTVPGNPADGFENSAMAMAAKTWFGEWWKFGGGGTVWNAMAYDAETDTLLIGTGNGAPWNRRVRSQDKGDNLFLCSIVALDGKTGNYKWHYQINPGETWDYNAAMDLEIADLVIAGRPRKVVMTAPKNGFFYVIDRTNGQLISAEPIVPITWAKKINLQTGRPEEDPGARYPNGTTFLMRPSSMGAHNWFPMAFNPKAGLVFIPTMDLAGTYSDQGVALQNWQRPPGMSQENAVTAQYVLDGSVPGSGTSSLLAWNPVTQKAVWRVTTPAFTDGGVLATAGDLVFQGQVDGKFNAYSAQQGTLLWSFDAQAPLNAPPISYAADNRQYVSVLTGFGTATAVFGPLLGSYDLDYRRQKRRLLTFTLGGTGALPPAPARATESTFPDPTFRPDAASAGRGTRPFGLNCAICHGFGAVAGGNAPDLRRSPVPLDSNAFAAVVRDGRLLDAGMPRFKDLDDSTREDIRQYIRTRRAD